MKKISGFIKDNYKFLIGVIVGLLLSGTGVYAANTIYSKNVTYDNSSSGLSATNVQDALDETYVKCFPPLPVATDEIIDLYNDGSDITTINIGENASNFQVKLNATQGIMLDNNGDYRYYGDNPNNYVTFNDETWRIIGVFHDVDNGTGKKETRLKIIRSEKIGDYSWDSSANTVNSGYGVNDWYDMERGTFVFDCDKFQEYDNACPRATTWTGKIALMYVSDYMYATDLSVCTKYDIQYGESECYTNNWANSLTWLYMWTIVPHGMGKKYSMFIGPMGVEGIIDQISVCGGTDAVPVLYLKSSTKIFGGSGTSSDPYQLG